MISNDSRTRREGKKVRKRKERYIYASREGKKGIEGERSKKSKLCVLKINLQKNQTFGFVDEFKLLPSLRNSYKISRSTDSVREGTLSEA